jgi:hypothetical protein
LLDDAAAAAAAAAVCRAHFQRRPTYSAHLLANKLFDQDNVRHQQTLQRPAKFVTTRSCHKLDESLSFKVFMGRGGDCYTKTCSLCRVQPSAGTQGGYDAGPSLENTRSRLQTLQVGGCMRSALLTDEGVTAPPAGVPGYAGQAGCSAWQGELVQGVLHAYAL